MRQRDTAVIVVSEVHTTQWHIQTLWRNWESTTSLCSRLVLLLPTLFLSREVTWPVCCFSASGCPLANRHRMLRLPFSFNGSHDSPSVILNRPRRWVDICYCHQSVSCTKWTLVTVSSHLCYLTQQTTLVARQVSLWPVYNLFSTDHIHARHVLQDESRSYTQWTTMCK